MGLESPLKSRLLGTLDLMPGHLNFLLVVHSEGRSEIDPDLRTLLNTSWRSGVVS